MTTLPDRPGANAIAALFTARNGPFLCARWAPHCAGGVGMDGASLAVFRAGMTAMFVHARHLIEPRTTRNRGRTSDC